jgi:hypothetical protein
MCNIVLRVFFCNLFFYLRQWPRFINTNHSLIICITLYNINIGWYWIICLFISLDVLRFFVHVKFAVLTLSRLFLPLLNLPASLPSVLITVARRCNSWNDKFLSTFWICKHCSFRGCFIDRLILTVCSYLCNQATWLVRRFLCIIL